MKSEAWKLLTRGLPFVGVLALCLIATAPALAASNWSEPSQIDHTTTILPNFLFPPEPPYLELPSSLTQISCASSSFCAAVDSGGNAFIYNGGTWSAPDPIAPGTAACGSKTCSQDLDSVSCPSSSFCVAVSTVGNAFVYDGGSWSAPELIDAEGSPQSVSCASATFCAVVDANDNALTFDGTSWSAPKRIDGEGNGFEPLFSVSCPSASFCAAVDLDGHVLEYNGSSWGERVKVDNTEIVGISCTSSSFCDAVDPNRNVLTLDGTTVTTETTVDPGGVALESISCASESFCVAGDARGNVLHYDGTSWSAPEGLGGGERFVPSVSCASVSFCAAIEGGSTSIYSPAPPPPPVERVVYHDWLFAGTLKDKQLGQMIALPAGATFNGSGEVNTQTGAGAVKGSFSIPAFSAPAKLFGFLPVAFGMTLTQVGALEGIVGESETVAGDEAFTLPAQFDLGVTSLDLFGVKIPSSCTTSKPLSLQLADELTRDELLHEVWHFSGKAIVPAFTCEGGFFPKLLALALTVILSGPENTYSLSVTAPAET